MSGVLLSEIKKTYQIVHVSKDAKSWLYVSLLGEMFQS
jgi:hypothetical protein